MAEIYNGKPCKVCAGTGRHRSTWRCIHFNRKDHLESRGALIRSRQRDRDYQRRRYNADPAYAEKSRARMRDRLATDPGYAERAKERAIEWRQRSENVERAREIRRESYARTRDWALIMDDYQSKDVG